MNYKSYILNKYTIKVPSTLLSSINHEKTHIVIMFSDRNIESSPPAIIELKNNELIFNTHFDTNCIFDNNTVYFNY